MLIIKDMVKRKSTHEIRLRNKSPQAREEHAQNLIIEYLDRNPDGVTVKHIVGGTGISRTTVIRHLERFVALRQSRKRDFGYVSLYYKGGFFDEDILESGQFGNNTSFTCQLVNREADGNFIYIQEKQIGDLREEKVTGGIMINTKDAQKFVKMLSGFASKVMEIESRI